MASLKTVLLVEDETNIVESLSFLLQRAGFEVKVANDGERALEIAFTQPLDVIVLDLMLPRLNGYEVLQRLRADPAAQTLPVLILTAKTQLADQETALAQGADAVITKPFVNAEVTAAVERLAGLRV